MANLGQALKAAGIDADALKKAEQLAMGFTFDATAAAQKAAKFINERLGKRVVPNKAESKVAGNNVSANTSATTPDELKAKIDSLINELLIEINGKRNGGFVSFVEPCRLNKRPTITDVVTVGGVSIKASAWIDKNDYGISLSACIFTNK